jgi:phosphatidylglycerol---prolipoprotein diacylglyceryl transferase
VHPIAFKLGTWPIYWYGVLVALGFVAGLWTASRRAPITGMRSEDAADSGLWIIIGTIIGARLLHVVSYWQGSYAGQPWWEVFMIQRGGLVFYGGLMGASFATMLYSRVRKVPLWKLADVLAPSIALGYVFGRLGCFTKGCCFGSQCSLPWAVRYPRGHETFPPGADAAIPVHPTQLYDSLLNLGLYLFLAWLYRRKKFDGQVFAAYLIIYAFTRSLVEHFRGDYTPGHIQGGLTPAQWVSVGILAAGIVLYSVSRKRRLVSTNGPKAPTRKPQTPSSK